MFDPSLSSVEAPGSVHRFSERQPDGSRLAMDLGLTQRLKDYTGSLSQQFKVGKPSFFYKKIYRFFLQF